MKVTFMHDLERKAITKGRLLGEGAYGTVFAGDFAVEGRDGTTVTPIAVKELKEGVSVCARVHFLQEASLLAQFEHENVVGLVGAVLSSDPLWIVTELCESSLLQVTPKG